MSGVARFVARWARLKHQAPVAAAKKLPPLDSLAADADLSAYLGQEVEAGLRRQALRRIFSDPALNVMDGLDVYIADYSLADPIPTAMLAQLNQARVLFAADQEEPPATSERAVVLVENDDRATEDGMA